MGARILDGEDVARQMGFTSDTVMRDTLASRRGWRPRAGRETVTARIDAGRWVADCPYCRGSEVVSKTAKVFFCLSCGMATDAGRVRVVVFPADVAGTEALVAGLPLRERYWTPS